MTRKQDADSYSHLDSKARLEKISKRNRLYAQWQEDNPEKSFQDYYGYVIGQHLDQGHTHPTLGKNLIEGRVFGEGGTKMLERLISLGLKPNHVCVDYGCGSLRIGCHFIRHLNSGCYWGLDVNQRFLRDGEELIGQDLIMEKAPNLHLISDETIAQARGAGPRFIFSKSVLLHVHPDELESYFERIDRLMAKHTQAVIDATVCEQAVQFEPLSWAYPKPALEEMVERFGCSVRYLEEKAFWLEASERDGAIITMLISRNGKTP
ncbi:MAG: class I SAM-dependent methyltransferase [Methyloligellaceae bacterium]